MNEFTKIAIAEAFYGMKNNEGGPFGAVIVRNGSKKQIENNIE